MLAWIALLLVAGAAGVRADPWYVHYENAERALAAEDWRKAVAEANAAIERRSDSGARQRSYGMKVVDYFPYLALGIAYQHLGENDAALQAFDTEERLGAVRASPAAAQELARYRGLTVAARDATTAAEASRREQVLQRSLGEARDLERRGLLDQAMAALAPGLAVAPDDPTAGALMASLRQRSAAAASSAETERNVASAIDQAKGLLAGGDPGKAASLLRQAIAARPSAEAQALLERAQRAIVESVAAARRAEQIQIELAAARRLAEAGQVTDALARLEVVLALDPAQPEASALRARWTVAAEDARRSAARSETLRAAEGELTAGRFEDALAAANRVLAEERGNLEALDVVRRAYVEISRRVLAATPARRIPPAIRFANSRQDVAGEVAERVRVPEFELSGVAISPSPVRIAFVDGDGREVASTSSSQAVGEYVITEFRLRETLRFGPTVFRAVATDAGGLTSTSEFAVIYERPWFKSPWFFVAALLLPLLAAGGIWRRVEGRRRGLRRRRFNPYIAGGPVFQLELFYGREPLIRRILQTVHTNSLMLYGERRIGKTSLLHQVRARLEALEDPEYRFHAVYVDLQGTAEERFFATLADQIFDGLVSELGAIDRAPALDRVAGYGHHDLVRELHDLLERLQAASAKRVRLVLLIDEVDELNHYDPRVNQRLRSLFMKRFAESLVAVVAGVRIRKEWEQEGSPWYNFFEEIEVPPIASADALDLVTRPIRGVFRLEAGVAERIVEISGRRPYLIQRLCLALVNRLHEEGRRTVTLVDVAAVASVAPGAEAK